MRHCCQFNPDDVYYLRENNLFSSRKLSIGFCPICSKPVCELVEWRFDGIMHKTSVSGIKANDLMIKHKDEIVYSLREYNYSKIKSKPFGWIFGINKSVKSGNGEKIKQYASDFYGNKFLIFFDRRLSFHLSLSRYTPVHLTLSPVFFFVLRETKV